MSLDARIRRVVPHADGLLVELMPRGMGPDAGYTWSEPGQDSLIIERPYTATPKPGQVVWGDAGTVLIGKAPQQSTYQRVSVRRLRERAPV